MSLTRKRKKREKKKKKSKRTRRRSKNFKKREKISKNRLQFTCPITLCKSRKIGMTVFGTCYDYKAINKWLIKSDKDPLTNEPLPSKFIINLGRPSKYKQEDLDVRKKEVMEQTKKWAINQSHMVMKNRIIDVQKQMKDFKEKVLMNPKRTLIWKKFNLMKIKLLKRNLNSSAFNREEEKLESKRMSETGSSFQNLLIKGVEFNSKTMKGLDFSGSRLINCTFFGCKLSNCKFIGCDLSGTMFLETVLYGPSTCFYGCKTDNKTKISFCSVDSNDVNSYPTKVKSIIKERLNRKGMRGNFVVETEKEYDNENVPFRFFDSVNLTDSTLIRLDDITGRVDRLNRNSQNTSNNIPVSNLPRTPSILNNRRFVNLINLDGDESNDDEGDGITFIDEYPEIRRIVRERERTNNNQERIRNLGRMRPIGRITGPNSNNPGRQFFIGTFGPTIEDNLRSSQDYRRTDEMISGFVNMLTGNR